MSVSISALLSSAALAQEITIADGDGSMENHFETNDGQHFTLKMIIPMVI